MGKLTGRAALITGASKGIGEGIARVYAQHGASLILAARSPQTEELARELSAQGTRAIAVETDVTDKRSVARCVQTAIDAYGKIDILVNNAGVCKLGAFLEQSDEDRDFHIDINLKGVWDMTRAVLPHMIQAQYGKIVIMSSVTGNLVADPGECAYAMTKAALIGLTKALARETAGEHITVNAICPGYVLTPMVEGMARQSNPAHPQIVLDGIADSVPLGRLADPKEIGELAAFLGCEESSYMTGAQFVIDGGATLPETRAMGV